MKGSFTGAFADRVGKFELADRGTLFLDEVGDMSLSAQAKVLRALEEGVISRVGSGKTRGGDGAVIAAPNKDLKAEIAAGRFRDDLLYRLNVVPIEVPPLRSRRGDIPQLIEHFVEQLTRRGGLPAKPFDREAVQRLAAHDWPGNIRELRNAVERLLILAPGPVATVADVERLAGMATGEGGRGTGAADLAGAPWARAATFEEFKQAAERAYLLAKLKENDWNVSETARTLEMPRSNLYKKIERYRLAREGEWQRSRRTRIGTRRWPRSIGCSSGCRTPIPRSAAAASRPLDARLWPAAPSPGSGPRRRCGRAAVAGSGTGARGHWAAWAPSGAPRACGPTPTVVACG